MDLVQWVCAGGAIRTESAAVIPFTAKSGVCACRGVGIIKIIALFAARALRATEGRARAALLTAAPPALVTSIVDSVGVGRDDAAVIVIAAEGTEAACLVGRIGTCLATCALRPTKRRARAALLVAVRPAVAEAVGDVHKSWGRRRRWR